MRFSDVAQLVIPEGIVQKITSGSVVLWEAPSADGLPSGYTQCEYIQFSGAQHVDTGIICTNDTTVELTFTREDDSARHLFCAASSDNKASVTAYQSGTSSGSWRFGGAYARPSVTLNTKHTLVMDKTGILWNGSTKYYNGTVGTFTCPVSLVLGTAHNANGSIGTVRHIGKVYDFKLWSGETLLAEYIPCTNPQGVYGFWDNVARAFRASEGSAEFTGG